MQGTHQFLVALKTRGFDPATLLAAARAEPSMERRKQILAGLRSAASQDQVDLRLAVEALGGALTTSFWSSNTALVEIPVASLSRLHSNSRVHSVWPNEARGPSTIGCTPVPIGESGNGFNHDFERARDTTQVPAHDPARASGAGVLVAFFDTGLDLNSGRSGPVLANACFDTPTGTSRLYDSLLVSGSLNYACSPTQTITLAAIDCNFVGWPVGTHPFGYVGIPSGIPPWQESRRIDALHGTAMASITLGYEVPVDNNTPRTRKSGHAPAASAVGIGFSRGTPTYGTCETRWITDAAGYLDGIQTLTDWIVSVGGTPEVLKVVNISYDGWPDPSHPVETALDQMANDLDVLIVTSAGNDGDSTSVSHGLYNGLAVGAVEKRVSATAHFEVPWYSVRGPLQVQPSRTFPDVCAVGGTYPVPLAAGSMKTLKGAHADEDAIGVPYAACIPRETVGTSGAAAQVSGAATLYAARRLAMGAPPSANEVRAAILASVADPMPDKQLATIHTYANRNAYGVGFVNDKFLAEFAERFGSQYNAALLGPRIATTPGGEVRTVPAAVGSFVDTAWTGLVPGQDYVVAATWSRVTALDNIDLEVLDSNGARLAISASMHHSFERVVFRTPVANVTLRLTHTSSTGAAIPVNLAARKHPETHVHKHAVSGMVEVIPQPSCAQTNPDQRITRTLPTSWAGAYGNRAFRFPGTGLMGEPHPMSSDADHWVIHDSIVGGAGTMTGLALRSWRPFNVAPLLATGATTLMVRTLGLAPVNYISPPAGVQAPGDPNPPALFLATYGATGGVVLAQNQAINFLPPPSQRWPAGASARLPNAQHWNTWNIRIPFQTSFIYQPSASMTGLAVWLDMNWVQPSIQTFPVDGVFDQSLPVKLKRGYSPSLDIGFMPCIGLCMAGSNSPVLDIFGDPVFESATGGGAGPDFVWLAAHSFGKAPPNGSLVGWMAMVLGSARADTPLGPCQSLVPRVDIISPWFAFPLANGADVFDFGLSLSPNLMGGAGTLLYRDLWVQAIHYDGTAFQASNTLHFRIGGNL